MWSVLSLNLQRFVIRTRYSFKVYQNIQTALSLSFGAGNICPKTNGNTGLSQFCQWQFNMPKRKMLQDVNISAKTTKLETSKAENSGKVMGAVLCKCSENSDTNDECTEHTTLLSSQASATQESQNAKSGSEIKATPAQQSKHAEQIEVVGNYDDTTSEQSSKIVSKDFISDGNAEVYEGSVSVHVVDDRQCNDLIGTHDIDNLGCQQLVDVTSESLGVSSNPDQQIEAVSREPLENTNETQKSPKATVLPKHLLEGITSLVSEKCEKEKTSLPVFLGGPPDAEEVNDLFGNLSSEEKVNFANKSSETELKQSTSADRDDKKKGKEEKVKRPRPNYFVAVQITNPQIHCGLSAVQLAVLSGNKRMKEVMIKLPTLHLTIMVMCLNTDEEIESASQALDECGRELRERFKDGLPVMEVAGVGTFRNQVVFAKVTSGDALDQLMYLHDCVKEKMACHGVLPTDDSSLTPHITIMKMSKVKGNFRRSVAKKIEPDLYSKYKDMIFGTETVSSLQLCSMEKPKDGVGYYHVAHQVYLGQGEVTVSQFSRTLVQSVLVSALETVKQDSYKTAANDDKQKTQAGKSEKSDKRKKYKSKKSEDHKRK